jgi:hypothetical protein
LVAQSFFSEIQGWFKKEYGADYGGRYVGLVIEHSARADPAPFQQFLSAIFGRRFHGENFVLSREFTFRGRNGPRRADLAILVENQVRALIELKYRDRLAQQSGPAPAQLDDYLAYCKRNPGCRFLLLHREPQRAHDVAQIHNAGQRLAHYAALGRFLRKSHHPVSAMLHDYFQGEGLVLEPIDRDYLYRFLHRFMLPTRDTGRIVTRRISEGPRQLQALLNNMRLFAADVTPQLMRVTGRESARAATIDFSVLDLLSKENERTDTS